MKGWNLGFRNHKDKNWLHTRTGYTQELTTHKNWLHTRTGYTQELATHKNWLHTRTGYTQELATHKNWLHTRTLTTHDKCLEGACIVKVSVSFFPLIFSVTTYYWTGQVLSLMVQYIIEIFRYYLQCGAQTFISLNLAFMPDWLPTTALGNVHGQFSWR
jgi:hypothetical protein